nr:hypothetical protein [Pandoravirus massiliensis]
MDKMRDLAIYSSRVQDSTYNSAIDRIKNRIINMTQSSDRSRASPRAFTGDDHPWTYHAKQIREFDYTYHGGPERRARLIKYLDDLAEVHFCIQNRDRFPARAGWIAAVIRRQCVPIWEGIDSRRLRPVLTEKVEALGEHAYVKPDYASVERRQNRFYTGIGMHHSGWPPAFDEWAPPQEPKRSSAWSRITGRSNSEISERVRDKLDANWACDQVSSWPNAPYGVKVAVERYCAATISERSNWAGMRRSA